MHPSRPVAGRDNVAGRFQPGVSDQRVGDGRGHRGPLSLPQQPEVRQVLQAAPEPLEAGRMEGRRPRSTSQPDRTTASGPRRRWRTRCARLGRHSQWSTSGRNRPGAIVFHGEPGNGPHVGGAWRSRPGWADRAAFPETATRPPAAARRGANAAALRRVQPLRGRGHDVLSGGGIRR